MQTTTSLPLLSYGQAINPVLEQKRLLRERYGVFTEEQRGRAALKTKIQIGIVFFTYSDKRRCQCCGKSSNLPTGHGAGDNFKTIAMNRTELREKNNDKLIDLIQPDCSQNIPVNRNNNK